MNNITTLENVFQRIDATFQTCHDSLIPVKQGLSQEHKNPKIDLSMIRQESLSN